MISAKVIADSKNEFGNRITTMIVTMPRMILAEFNTHRMFSRNSASSRAIPFEKMVKSVEENPFIPIAWQKDHRGMQGTEYFTDQDTTTFNIVDKDNIWRGKVKEGLYSDYLKQSWLLARDKAVNAALELSGNSVTKQLCNRLLEPFMWHTVIVTATEWENFFALRAPRYRLQCMGGSVYTYRSKKDALKYQKNDWDDEFDFNNNLEWLKRNIGQAEIHMMALAEAMWDALNESTPKELKAGEWHIPFGDQITLGELAKDINRIYPNLQNPEYRTEEQFYTYALELTIKIATARCAQVSYTVVGEEGKEMNYEKLIALHDRLAKSGHWSPFEHCAQVMSESEMDNNWRCEDGFTSSGWSGNFQGFRQYRKMFENENITK